MYEITTLPPRSQVPLYETWDLESIFPNPTDWDAACKQLGEMLPTLSAYQGRIKESPQVLLEYLNKM